MWSKYASLLGNPRAKAAARKANEKKIARSRDASMLMSLESEWDSKLGKGRSKRRSSDITKHKPLGVIHAHVQSCLLGRFERMRRRMTATAVHATSVAHWTKWQKDKRCTLSTTLLFTNIFASTVLK